MTTTRVKTKMLVCRDFYILIKFRSTLHSSGTVVEEIFSKCPRMRKEVKLNMVQLKLDWINLPNVRNGSYLGI